MEVLLLCQQDLDGHLLHGGTPCLTPKICGHGALALDVNACAQHHQAAQARQGIADCQCANVHEEHASEEADHCVEEH
jgi:hypothetical protein